MRTQPFPEPDLWMDGEPYYATELEAKLAASIEEEYQKQKARPSSPPQRFDEPTAPTSIHALKTSSQAQIQHNPTLTQLVAGCGIASVDAYLSIRDYAATKGVHLAEIAAAGIDLQDLVSTLIINETRKAEPPRRGNYASRF